MTAPEAAAPTPQPAPTAAKPPGLPWLPVLAAVLALACVVSLVLVWQTQQRVRVLESELVRRQQTSQDAATEARLLARQASDVAADAAAKQALLEARVAESALQRDQIDELLRSFSRSRDENALADIEAALRVAQQQSELTGSPEPLLATLRQADERLAHINQPRLERVRRAIARDTERLRAAQVLDVPALSVRLDEISRDVDDMALLATPARVAAKAKAAPAAPPVPAAAASQPAWRVHLGHAAAQVWQEARSLVRVTRIASPEAMLIAPEQGYFLRENVKLRLLNARLALLSRQGDVAQRELAAAHAAMQRYFDPGQRRVAASLDALAQATRQVAQQRPTPRPDDTLAALATMTK
ncbi:MAG: uroporphyrinogen-III C-methyltransferase [Proteobacteria bacterium]|nr:uroporphyrinogen-III C-methyltransferase [Pseudomonadota bacterium]